MNGKSTLNKRTEPTEILEKSSFSDGHASHIATLQAKKMSFTVGHIIYVTERQKGHDHELEAWNDTVRNVQRTDRPFCRLLRPGVGEFRLPT